MSMRNRYNAFIERHEVVWELAFAGLAVLFVALAFVPVTPGSGEEQTLFALEWLITIIFALEFSSRILASYDRRAYFRAHWIDIISLVPPVRWMRAFRLVRLLRLIRAFAGVGRALGHVQRLAGHRGLIWLILAWAAVMLLCAVALYIAENGVNAAVDEPLDALWWGITTMTTVGYGDVFPITWEGRLAAAILMILGIGLFSAITAVFTSFLLEARPTGRDVVGGLERLAALRARSDLTDDEFIAAKGLLIGAPAGNGGGS